MDSIQQNNMVVQQPYQTQNQMFSTNTLIIIILVIVLFSFTGFFILDILKYIIIKLYKTIIGLLSFLGFTSGVIIDKTSNILADTSKTGIDIANGTVNDIGNLFIQSSQKGVVPSLRDLINTTADQSTVFNSMNIPQQTDPPSINLFSENYFSNFFNNILNEPRKLEQRIFPITTTSVYTDDDSTTNTNNVGTPYPREPQPDSTENPIQNPISSNKMNWCLVGEFNKKRGCVPVADETKCLSGQVFPNQAMCLNPTLTANVPRQ